MDKKLITTLQNEFNQLSNTLEESAIEYWYARDLQKILGYNSWDKFQNVITKAKIAYENSGVEVSDHFRQVGKMVQIGSEAMREVDDSGFGRIRSKGDTALFGGNTTQNMKDKLSVPNGRPLADFLPTITITAKNLATEITNHNVKQNNLYGENSITNEHIQNNESVRGLLGERGIRPEELPPAKDLKKLERKVKFDEKKMIK